MRKIKDEFSELNVSRQRKWQLRKYKARKCVICGEKAVTAAYCLKHAIQIREAQRRRYNSLTYRLANGATK